ncbi:MAG: RHS repeat-associated core domain-containing protein [Erysipelotrichaceae bacterium]|nr:RHS repeat-associated core domain-containing protein [Erysipelotrichaceae bacterium]
MEYDVETGLFWLSSRYYSPELCRFISPDDVDYLDPSSINGLNLYAYANNNPIMYYDPSGHSAILIGLLIGALIGFGTVAYIDYQDDGQIFNGSVAWYDYLGATVLGGAIGAGLGAFAGMSFSASIPTFGWINSGGALMYGITGTMAVTVTGAQVLGVSGALAAGGLLMFAKGNGPRMGHNQYENKQFNSLCNKYKLTKEQRRILHDYISGQNYSYHEIEQIIKELFFS